jgi:hypothetical protein
MARALVIEACLFVQEWRAKFREFEALASLARGEQEEQSENLTKPVGTNNPDRASRFQTA